jgi:hypothetical protein
VGHVFILFQLRFTGDAPFLFDAQQSPADFLRAS